jgi:leucyl-tRNA synthetase
VLANEQVLSDGTAERSGAKVEKRDLAQWFFKITDYADALIDDLDKVDWPESTVASQKNWIGRSEGAEILFKVKDTDFDIKVFTTRPDTLFGATYMVFAPEHELLNNNELGIKNYEEVEKYIKKTEKKSDLDRQKGEKEKTGVELVGVKAINPANNEEIPIFIADYVLSGYGTGAIMAVPAHDERDFEFATKYELPIKPVILKTQEQSYSFVMGVDEEDLNKLGITVVEKTESGFFKITIPFDRLEEYKIFIREWMRPGFWNEFSTNNGFYFIFKHKDGHLEEMELNTETNDLIDRYGMTFNDKSENETPENVYTWLSANSFYKNILIHPDEGVLVNSGEFDGLSSEEAREKITKKVGGEMKTTYKLRDWLISRQRYWGAPIPIVYDPEGNPHAIPEEHLPWLLPEDVDFEPKGYSPLSKSKELKERTEKIFGEGWTPEVDTMDTFVCSSWYYFRFTDSQNDKEFASKAQIKKWMPVDLYMGGAEHTVLHLLYSRFFTKVLNKLGYIDIGEPFLKLRHQGMILAEDGRKMSKSIGNVINPNEVVKNYGADTLRMYEMFMGPIEDAKPWNTESIIGPRKFLERVWRMFGIVENDQNDIVEIALHQTIKKVTEDIESLKFNTAISAMMIFVNVVEKEKAITEKQFGLFLVLLAPFAPFITEELWEKIGDTTSIHLEKWPEYDESKLVSDTVSVAVQVNGKTRGTVESPNGASEEEVLALVRADEDLSKWMDGEAKKIVYVENRLISIVI